MDHPSANVTPDLLGAVRKGNQQAARELVEMLYPLVVTIVRRHLPRGEAEEDLCQEVFLKMFSRLSQYSGQKAFDHWVSKIALNTCYDKLRRLNRRKVMSYAELDTEEADFLAPLDSLSDSQALEGSPGLARELLDKLLAHLNPRETIIIRLLDLEEKSVNEVCDLLDWKPSRVRVTAMRARRKLTSLLLELEKQPPTTLTT
ncbi:MAG: RNA polymerase sigma-70 factor (ECF subfamily) [Akkermansiaceae bacterium]|jgi:RNA polymerase sigma factor (sigma-70 family)